MYPTFSFFYLQYNIETDTKNRLVAQQIKNQMQSTKKISVHIASDLNSIVVALHGLANSIYVQQGELSSDKTQSLLQETYLQINTITVVDRLFILDKKNTATAFIVPQGESEPFFGSDNISFEDLINNTRTKLVPTFSSGFKGLDDVNRIAITYPILNRDTQEYIGCIVALIPTLQFFEHYGNVNDINTQFLTAYDENGTYLSNPSKDLIGRNFFSNEVQQFIRHNNNLNQLVRKVVLDGQASQAIYNFGSGERLATGYPISEQGKPIYFVFVITPTSLIYSEINQVLFLERIETFSLLAGTTAAITFLIVFLLNWSSNLDREVKRRTIELESTNRQLTSANEQLKTHDKLQKQFINAAAHELRTPLQPIISYGALALKNKVDKIEAIQTILKQARRLNKLTTDLLEIIRIEDGRFNYNREKIRINDVILGAVREVVSSQESLKNKDHIYRIDSNDDNGKDKNKLRQWAEIEAEHQLANEKRQKIILPLERGATEEEQVLIELDLDCDAEVYADRVRIAEAVFKVIDNAIKFTKRGKIKIETHSVIDDRQNAPKNCMTVIKVSDSGPGIPEDILPSLFGKFVTKSVLSKESMHGSGLGLFISKSIVKAHKGEITAHNNESGGATITIVLPSASGDIRNI